MERLDGKNSIPTHMKNKTRYCKHKHVTLSENDTSRGAFLTSASLQINDKPCKAFCSSHHTQVFIRVHTCIKVSFFIQPLHMMKNPSVLISEQDWTVFKCTIVTMQQTCLRTNLAQRWAPQEGEYQL